jgi:hypothetical protein
MPHEHEDNGKRYEQDANRAQGEQQRQPGTVKTPAVIE